MSELFEVEVFTDGACRGNPGPGGWAAILRYRAREKDLGGFEPDTTNNRMEMTAAIAGLEALKRPCRVRLYSDSQYLRDGITKWINGWNRRGSAPHHLDLGTRSFRSSRKRAGRCAGARSYRRSRPKAVCIEGGDRLGPVYKTLSIASALETSTWPGCASTLRDLTMPLSTSIA